MHKLILENMRRRAWIYINQVEYLNLSSGFICVKLTYLFYHRISFKFFSMFFLFFEH